MHGRLYRYLEALGLLCNTRFGIKKGHWTRHTMHHLVDNVNIAFERGKIPSTVFIDFKKAFDTVDFELLLRRLNDLGIRDTCLDWFRSCLHERSMQVVIIDTTSAASQVNCGVLQISVLGPLISSIYWYVKILSSWCNSYSNCRRRINNNCRDEPSRSRSPHKWYLAVPEYIYQSQFFKC